jgi:hypothetical protein
MASKQYVRKKRAVYVKQNKCTITSTGVVIAYFRVIFQHLPGGWKTQSGLLASRIRTKPTTFQIQNNKAISRMLLFIYLFVSSSRYAASVYTVIYL